MTRVDIVVKLVAAHAARGCHQDLMHNVTTYTIVQAGDIADKILKEDKQYQQQRVRERLE